MSKRLKVILAVVGVAGLLLVTVGGSVLAAGPANGAGSGTDCDCGQEMRLGDGGSGNGFYGSGVCDAVCQLLGITQDELHALRLEGKSLAEIAADRGVSEDALVEAIMAVKRAAVQEQVEAGTLTQEQAELKLQNMLAATYRAVNRTTGGPSGGSQGGAGNSWGECSDGTGPGDMHQWGKNAH